MEGDIYMTKLDQYSYSALKCYQDGLALTFNLLAAACG